jgi:hypothetical protein
MTREEHVREAWDNAVDNGYDQWLLESEAIDVAINMMDCDADIEAVFDLDFDGLVAIVRKIQKEKRNA